MAGCDRIGHEYSSLREARGSTHHAQTKKLLQEFAEGDSPWALPWPCIYEFIRVVTHPRVFDPPTGLGDVLSDLNSLLQSPGLTLLREGPRHEAFMQRLLRFSQATGNLVDDAHIAALVAEHGVSEFWTGDRDFGGSPKFVYEIRSIDKAEVKWRRHGLHIQ